MVPMLWEVSFFWPRYEGKKDIDESGHERSELAKQICS